MDWTKVTHHLPPDFYFKTGLVILVIVGIVVVVKVIRGANKIFLSIFFAVAFGLLFFSWIYNRNEPKFLTPFIDILANWFPTKGAMRPEAGDLTKHK